MSYTTLLFDFDHTLFDTDASEAAALTASMATVGLSTTPEELDAYQRINAAMWRDVERGTITPLEVRTERFVRFCAERRIDADPVVMADAFVAGLCDHGELYEGAAEVLHLVAGRARLAMVTNGLGEVQRARVARLGLDRWFEVLVISAEVGVAKPSPAIFDLAFAALADPAKVDCLMIGDSLGSDILGGSGYGIATCWYNPAGRPVVDGGPRATHEIASLVELPTLVDTRGGRAGGPRGGGTSDSAVA